MTCHAHALAASRAFLTEEEVDCLRALAHDVRSQADAVVRIADLGAGAGTTALCMFAEFEPASVHITSVDSNETELYWMSRAVENIGRMSDHRAVLRDALEVVAEVPDASLDILLCDISYETQRILEAWLPKCKPGACVWQHDYDPPAGDPSAVTTRDAVEALVASGALVAVKRCGLGWMGVVAPASENPLTEEKTAKSAETPPPPKVTRSARSERRKPTVQRERTPKKPAPRKKRG